MGISIIKDQEIISSFKDYPRRIGQCCLYIDKCRNYHLVVKRDEYSYKVISECNLDYALKNNQPFQILYSKTF